MRGGTCRRLSVTSRVAAAVMVSGPARASQPAVSRLRLRALMAVVQLATATAADAVH